jgi:hypothetical protein
MRLSERQGPCGQLIKHVTADVRQGTFRDVPRDGVPLYEMTRQMIREQCLLTALHTVRWQHFLFPIELSEERGPKE